MGVKKKKKNKKKKNGEYIMWKLGATNTNYQILLFLLLNCLVLMGENDPNLYLGWEAKVNQIFNVYEVEEDQKVKLTFLEFLDYAMQW